jgi:hypothetical protein
MTSLRFLLSGVTLSVKLTPTRNLTSVLRKHHRLEDERRAFAVAMIQPKPNRRDPVVTHRVLGNALLVSALLV